MKVFHIYLIISFRKIITAYTFDLPFCTSKQFLTVTVHILCHLRQSIGQSSKSIAYRLPSALHFSTAHTFSMVAVYGLFRFRTLTMTQIDSLVRF